MIVALRAELQDARRGCRRLREERDAARAEAGTAAELRVALAEARAARGIAGRLQEHVQREPERVLRWWGSIPEARAAVLGAHVRGDLSEGQACRMLGVDRAHPARGR